MSQLLSTLNPEQAEAVQAVDGPVLVLAGPGSGKTRVLTHRIAYMIEEAGIAPWNILAVTFTNKAAREMRERVERLLGDQFGPPLPGQPPRLGGLAIGTFHSIGARILRVETARIGYQRDWVIYDAADQLALTRAILRELNLDEKRYSPKAIKAHISKQKNELITPEEYRQETYFEEIAGRVYTRYQEAIKANNALDFDDLLMRTALLLRDDLEMRVKYQRKWRYLLVDEFQDTNLAQYKLLQLMAGEPENNRNLFAVGDDDQSIYRFRGADYRNVLRFRKDYPDARVILLEQNYRSTQTILDVANAVIANNRSRTPKTLHTENDKGLEVRVYEAYNENEEASYVCDEIERLVASRALPTATLRSCIAPTPRAAPWKRSSSCARSSTSWWARPASTNAWRSRTRWPIYAWSTTRWTAWPWTASSTSRPGASVPRPMACSSSGPRIWA
jgi:DNA helicase-2/ATP-dependent DNA helicase PcrA